MEHKNKNMADKTFTYDKVLFLDIDGVVNCATTNFKTEHWPLDRYMAFLVGKIQLETGCQVVLSSSWRHHEEGTEEVSKRIVQLSDRTSYGFRKSDGSWSTRGDEIQEWLDRHPEVTKYAILDDDSDMLESQLPNFFHTRWATGLTEEIANKVIEHLGVKQK